MGAARHGRVRRQRVVLLQPARPQVPERHPAQPRRRVRVLEGHRHRQAHPRRRHRRGRRRQEGARLLQGPPAQGHQDQLDHARVPPRRRRHRTQAHQVPQRLHEAGRLGAVPDLQQVRPGVADGAAARRLRPPGPRRAVLWRLRRLLLLRAVVEQQQNHDRAASAGRRRRRPAAPEDPVHVGALRRRLRARPLLRLRRRARPRRPASRPPFAEPAPGRRQQRARRGVLLRVPSLRRRRRERGDEAQGEPGRTRRRPPACQEAPRVVLRRAASAERPAIASGVVGAGRSQPSHAFSVLSCN